MNHVADIADAANELTQSRVHIEPICDTDRHRNRRVRRIWRTTVPGLLVQLESAMYPGEVYVEGDGTRRHRQVAPRPPARLDAIDRLLAIEAGAAMWCTRLRLPLRESTASNIRALVGAAGAMDPGTQRQLLADLQRWVAWAETVTGWQRPPDVPRAPCPACGHRSTLRVRLERRTACCMACGAAWDQSTIGVLAQHVRDHLAASEAAAAKARSEAVATRRRLEATAHLDVVSDSDASSP